MSALQEEAKPLLLPLILGQQKVLTVQEQETIAAWAAMTCMVAEFIEERKVAVSPAERQLLMEQKKPPPNWKIWIARYVRRSWPADWVHKSFRVSDVDVPHPEDHSLSQPNTQSTVFVVGELYICAFSAEDESVIKSFNFEPWTKNLLLPIWPEQQATIFWPVYAISDRQAIRISEYPMDLYHSIAQFFGA